MAEPFFTAVVEALLAGRDIGAAYLVSFHFTSKTMRVWTGFGKLRTPDGEIWQGLGEIGDLGPLQLGGLPTEQVRARLVGLEKVDGIDINELTVLLKDSEAECEGRLARVHVVFFDPLSEDGWKPISAPFVLRTFVMGAPVVDIDMARADTHIVELPLEPRTVDKHRANYSIISHLEQQRRWPGDPGLERMGKIAGTGRVEW